MTSGPGFGASQRLVALSWGGVLIGLSCAGTATLAMFIIGLAIVSTLPRPTQGEAVSIPWSACIVGYYSAVILVPWLASWAILKRFRERIVFLLMLVTFTLIEQIAAHPDDLLFKAWQRGL